MNLQQRNDASPCITIITSTFNCDEALKATAASIREQTHKKIQWIIADGASTDCTVKVIKDNLDIVTDWFSEPDSGIYDAWNKACRIIKGDWVIFLGAGDVLFNSNTLELLAKNLSTLSNETKLAYGRALCNNTETGRIGNRFDRVGRPVMPHHQSIAHKSIIFNKPFDQSYKIAADYKFNIEHLLTSHLEFIDITISIVDSYGVSSLRKNSRLVNKERNMACIDNKLNLNKIALFISFVKSKVISLL